MFDSVVFILDQNLTIWRIKKDLIDFRNSCRLIIHIPGVFLQRKHLKLQLLNIALWLPVSVFHLQGCDVPSHDGDVGSVGSSPGALTPDDPVGIWGQLRGLFGAAAHRLHLPDLRLARCLLHLRWGRENTHQHPRLRHDTLRSLTGKMPLCLSGGVGCFWAVFWFCLVSDDPRSHPRISQEERDYIINSIGPQVHMKH